MPRERLTVENRDRGRVGWIVCFRIDDVHSFGLGFRLGCAVGQLGRSERGETLNETGTDINDQCTSSPNQAA